MDSTYSPHSPDLNSSSFLSSQQLSKQQFSSQPYAPRSPTLPHLDTSTTTTINSNNKHNNSNYYYYHINPNSYPDNTNINPINSSNSDISRSHYIVNSPSSPFNTPVSALLNTQNFSYISPTTSSVPPHVQQPYSSSNPHHSAPALASAQSPNRLSWPCNQFHLSTYSTNENIISRSNPRVPSDPIYSPTYSQTFSQTPVPSNTTALSSPNTMSSFTRAGARGKIESYKNASSSNSHLYNTNTSNLLKVEIKTKFPVARIKRIMQADEEVGKVAQVTPVAVSKALELFMIALVSGAADKAREKGSKKVNAQHLKMVVEGQPERFDFLADIVSRVGEGGGGGGDGADGVNSEGGKALRKRKDESDSTSDDEKVKVKKKGIRK